MVQRIWDAENPEEKASIQVKLNTPLYLNVINNSEMYSYIAQHAQNIVDNDVVEDDEILIEDLCLYSISYNNEIIGKVMEYRSDNGNEMIFVRGKYIPYNRDFIESIDKEKYIIYYKNIGGLI